MNINDVQNPEKLLQMYMLQNVMKQGFGDGMEFEIVYQSLLNSMQNSSSSEENNVFVPVGVGQNLKEIPLTYLNGMNYDNTSVYGTSSVSTLSSDEKMVKIYDAVNKYSKEFGVDPKLALAVIKTESDFNPKVVSSAGAMGLMQLMPVNCKEDGVTDPFDIEDNIRGGIKQLKGHIDRYNGDIDMALMAYNAGQGTMKRRGVVSASDLYKMPKETQNYVPKVMKYYINGV